MAAEKKSVLVAGGAGYIGSQVVLDLKEAGYHPVIVDNFVAGNRDIASTLGVPVFEGALDDRSFVRSVLKETKPVAVMHFAAFAYVGESVLDPQKYYANNVVTTLALLEMMREARVNKFIFSSTCATYGTPERLPITEETPQNPINPYGFTKLAVERILRDFDVAYGMKSVVFRYFNASGAHPSGCIGERHDPESHLIPLAMYAAMGRGELSVFGDDYDTPDGTCVRDYIHVADISQAHILGLEDILKNARSNVFNIGTGVGNSVLEVIRSVEKVSGTKVPYVMKPRRAGDPPRLVAAAEKLSRELGWKPRYTEIDEIIKTAWAWHQKDASIRK